MAPKTTLRFPGPTNRTTVIGRTGSGKSHFAAWLLSLQNFDAMPWVIIDFKDEDTDIINKIDRVQTIDYDTVPDKSGLYILKPMSSDTDDLERWLWMVFQRGNVGLFFDEVFPIGQHNEAFNTILMQGRSRNVPVIVCTQRPTNISVYCFSEASFYYVFDLTKKRDRQTVSHEIGIPANYQLPPYHSYQYDVSAKTSAKLLPAPKESDILDAIEDKLPATRRTL